MQARTGNKPQSAGLAKRSEGITKSCMVDGQFRHRLTTISAV
jgi:hypothetical protein